MSVILEITGYGLASLLLGFGVGVATHAMAALFKGLVSSVGD
jgi:hypothetical protein